MRPSTSWTRASTRCARTDRAGAATPAPCACVSTVLKDGCAPAQRKALQSACRHARCGSYHMRGCGSGCSFCCGCGPAVGQSCPVRALDGRNIVRLARCAEADELATRLMAAAGRPARRPGRGAAATLRWRRAAPTRRPARTRRAASGRARRAAPSAMTAAAAAACWAWQVRRRGACTTRRSTWRRRCGPARLAPRLVSSAARAGPRFTMRIQCLCSPQLHACMIWARAGSRQACAVCYEAIGLRALSKCGTALPLAVCAHERGRRAAPSRCRPRRRPGR